MRAFLQFLVCLAVCGCTSVTVAAHRLWYRDPAPDTIEGWERLSMPVGCGWFGASVFGGVTNERIQVTHNAVLSKWETRNRPNLTDALEILIGTDHAEATDYSRGLDLETATAWVGYACGKVKFRREVRASYPARTMAIRLTASEKGALDFTLAAGAPFLSPFGRATGTAAKLGRTARCTVAGDEIDVYQELEDFAIRFDSRLRVVTDGKLASADVPWTFRESDGRDFVGFTSELAGDVTRTLRGIRVTGATEATVYFSCGTNYRLSPRCFAGRDAEKLDPVDPSPDVKRRVDAAVTAGYDAFVAEHRKDVSGLMDRVALDLGGMGADAELPTDELLKACAQGCRSAYLEETYFQFGRYLLLSSSRPGTLPANLQGIWTAHRYSPWGSGYWHNINVQMNYWPAFTCNLAECFEAYAAFNEAFRPVTRDAAWDYVKRVSPANLPSDRREAADWWSVATAVWPYRVDAVPGGHSGPGTLGLTTKLFADWWYFTRDEKVLRERVWPVLHGAADFLSRCCVETNGLFLAAESASPEQFATKLSSREYMRTHGGRYPPYYRTVGCAFDQQMICENARDFLAAAEALGTNDAVVARIRREVGRYDPVLIGTSGQVKEYREENAYGEIGEYRHRHISQLVGLMPGTLITSARPDWMRAARVTLTERGDKSTGWALAHRLCAWARAGDGDRAHRLLANLLATKTHPNLWDVHPPFQIDGNFGATAGMAEMLLQSHAGCIELLPALPSAWRAHGSFRGLCARGAFEVSCAWTNGVPTAVSVVSRKGLKPDVRFAGRPVGFELKTKMEGTHP